MPSTKCKQNLTTNGNVKKNGEAVMGKGIALEADRFFPDLKHRLAREIKTNGNKVVFFHDIRITCLPTKNNWWEKSDIGLIESGVKYLSKQCISKTYLPYPGCGNGGLNRKDVKPILEKYLDDRFVIVERRRSNV